MVPKIIDEVLLGISEGTETEIAFFGGSFTGIDRALMIRMLDIAQGYIDRGRVKSIRLSTRPDYIDEERIEILSRYGVKTVELGIQSMRDRVLSASNRGHTAADTEKAMDLLLKAGFDAVGQMMIGLPESDIDDEIFTARRICEMGAKGARIYPTAVFAETELENMRRRGEYIPLDTEDAVERSCRVMQVFDEFGVKVIRVGLCENDGLHTDSGITAGSFHPAFGEICAGRMYRYKIENAVKDMDVKGKKLTVSVPKSDVSKAIGNKGVNREYFIEKYGVSAFSVVSDAESDFVTIS